jgi:hypothetical protein
VILVRTVLASAGLALPPELLRSTVMAFQIVHCLALMGRSLVDLAWRLAHSGVAPALPHTVRRRPATEGKGTGRRRGASPSFDPRRTRAMPTDGTKLRCPPEMWAPPAATKRTGSLDRTRCRRHGHLGQSLSVLLRRLEWQQAQ